MLKFTDYGQPCIFIKLLGSTYWGPRCIRRQRGLPQSNIPFDAWEAVGKSPFCNHHNKDRIAKTLAEGGGEGSWWEAGYFNGMKYFFIDCGKMLKIGELFSKDVGSPLSFSLSFRLFQGVSKMPCWTNNPFQGILFF